MTSYNLLYYLRFDKTRRDFALLNQAVFSPLEGQRTGLLQIQSFIELLYDNQFSPLKKEVLDRTSTPHLPHIRKITQHAVGLLYNALQGNGRALRVS